MTNNTPDYEDNLYFPQLKEGENSFKATFDNHFSLKKTEGLDFSELLQNSENVANNVANKNLQHLTNYDILKEYEAHQTPVPSYDEWKQLKERVSKLEKMQYSYTPEEWNTMLRTVNRTKELLKECRPYIGFDTYEFDEKVSKLLDKIDEVLK